MSTKGSYISRTSGIGIKDKLGYAFGDLASCLVFGLTQSVLNKYYTDVLEISVLHVLIMTVIARIWDAINDPIWGRIIDRAGRRADGRYRRWIKYFSLPAALAAVLMFLDVRGFASTGKLVWIYATYILFGMLYTCINIPYGSMAQVITPDDIESDTAGTEILVYILIAVIAFIFAVTIDSTIEKEAPVIGTLRASGFTKGELIRHYMTVPVIITLLGAALGNLLGYTVFKDVAVDLYYNSYSMPKYQTVWSPAALVKTTIIPLVLMFCINLTVIVSRLRLSPLRFLRRDLKRTKRAKARRLPRWSFLRRFRIRILLQNIPNYLILTFGVVFIEIMLCFAFGFPDSLDHYAQNAPDMLFAKYQYLLTDTENEDGTEITVDSPEAERFSAAALLLKNGTHDESVTVYGYELGSRYVSIRESLTGSEVCVSRAMSQKYGLQAGDTVRLSEKYKHKDYEFRVMGIFDYDGGVALFLPNENFNQLFDRDAGSFNGYFSNTELADLPESKIASVMTARDITKITDQLDHSIGGFMGVFQYALLALSVILLYLLSKIIIEKNEHAISMVKILGFRTGEIASLYILTTAIMVLFSALIGFAAGYAVIQVIFRIFMMRMDGWFSFYLSPSGGVLAILFVILGYALVTAIDFHRIKRIPLDEALKNVE